MPIKICLPLFLLLFSLRANCQTKISGKVSDEDNNAIIGATISVKNDYTKNIIAYAISNSHGEFKLRFKDLSESILLEVQHLGFAPWNKQILNRTQNLFFTLKPRSEELKEVFIESRAIERKGDTINYSVASFKDQNDRVIADVLRKMPGIEIRGSGQIYYQGEPIQKYYIEGMDLLEGRYNLANNNLSADDVGQVQILENHQPVKVLDSLEFSEKASINIQLKNKVAYTGSAELGIGISPLIWKANITPMLFTDKQQALISYQSNNSGKNVSSEIEEFSIEDFGQNSYDITKPKNWLSLRQLSIPALSDNLWLDNNVHLGSINYLVRVKKDLDLKANLSYLNDAQNQLGEVETIFFTPQDTITISEDLNNKLFKSNFESKFIIENNTQKDYLKNTLEINSIKNHNSGKIRLGQNQISQNLNSPYSALRNKLKFFIPIGDHLFKFQSNIIYTKLNQALGVQSGQYKDLLNEGRNYEKSFQDLNTLEFVTKNSVGFSKKIKNFSLSPEIGYSYKNQNLKSQLNVINDQEITPVGGAFQNNLQFQVSNIFFTNTVNYQQDSWKLRFQSPIYYRSFDTRNINKNETKHKITFEPILFIKKNLSPIIDMSFLAGIDNKFGDFQDLYIGYILTDYRNLQRFNTPLPENFTQNYNWRMSLRDPISSIFASSSLRYSKTKRNLLFSSLITETGATVFEAVEETNYQQSYSLNLRGSKYFGNYNSTLSLSSNFTSSVQERLINQSLVDVQNQTLNLGFKVETEITSWLSATSRSDFNYLFSSVNTSNGKPIAYQSHSQYLYFYLSENQYISLDSEYYFNSASANNQSSYFLNFKYQHTLKKPAVEIIATYNNIFNTNKYVNVINSEFAYIQKTYQLRPAQFLITVKFSL